MSFKLKYEARGALADKDLSEELASLNERVLIEPTIVQGGGAQSISYEIPKKEVLVFLDANSSRQDAIGVAVGFEEGMILIEPKVALERNNSNILTIITQFDPPKYRLSPVVDHEDKIDSFVVKEI